MTVNVELEFGDYSDKGIKAVNQDCCGKHIPTGAARLFKGAAFVVADGISSSPVSQIAAEMVVNNFLNDYFCTSEAWTVKHSVECVINALNTWLYAEGKQSVYPYDKDKGYVATYSAVVVKADVAHVFHVGDSRVYRLRGGALEQLTNDHRLWLSSQESYLSRALGAEPVVDIDYQQFGLLEGDVIILATDGIYEHVPAESMIQCITSWSDDLKASARAIGEKALRNGSGDNLTVQLIKVARMAGDDFHPVQRQVDALPFPPELNPPVQFDGFRVLEALRISSRSHVYLAVDIETDQKVVMKIPSVDLRDDEGYLQRFLMEEWIARRISSAYVVRPFQLKRPRNYLYTVSEYVPGRTLAQWLLDHPSPELEKIRDIIEQVARGLYAFHRKDMLHQDIRPENLIIDSHDRVIIIDFGSTRVAGVDECGLAGDQSLLLGTALYAAPEYFLGEMGTVRSDLFSLAVLTYHMLTGNFPYGTQVAKHRTLAGQKKLAYKSALREDRAIPSWVDGALKKALHPDPERRYGEISEFIADLRNPNPQFSGRSQLPFIDNNPVAFWKGVSLVSLLALLLKTIAPYLW